MTYPQYYVTTLKGGGTWITQLLSGTMQEEVAKWPQEMQDQVYQFHLIDDPATVPPDRTFRNALRYDSKKGFDYDMVIAKDIHLESMRTVREPILKRLDIEFSKATNNPVKQKEVEARRQILRDVTKVDLSKVKTTDELKAVWPEILRL